MALYYFGSQVLACFPSVAILLSCTATEQVYPDFEEYHRKIGGITYWQRRDFLCQQWTAPSACSSSYVNGRLALSSSVDASSCGPGKRARCSSHSCVLSGTIKSCSEKMLGDPKVYNLCNMTPSAAQRHLAHTAKSKWFKETQLGHSTTCGSSHFVRIVQNEEEILRCPPHHQLHIPSVCQIVSHRLCADANDEGRFSEVCLKCSRSYDYNGRKS